MELLAPGSLLVSNPEMVDPNFEGSVVLICSHDEAGAMGVSLNRPMEITVGELLSEEPALADRADPIGWGGPVGLETLHVLHDHADDALSMPVADGLRFGGDLELVRAACGAGARLRFFLGYSGWGEGQLEAEMLAGAWRLVPPTADGRWSEVWEASPTRQWERLVANLDPRYGWMRALPDDPRSN
jgi:putative transcriptional regulator